MMFSYFVYKMEKYCIICSGRKRRQCRSIKFIATIQILWVFSFTLCSIVLDSQFMNFKDHLLIGQTQLFQFLYSSCLQCSVLIAKFSLSTNQALKTYLDIRQFPSKSSLTTFGDHLNYFLLEFFFKFMLQNFFKILLFVFIINFLFC